MPTLIILAQKKKEYNIKFYILCAHKENFLKTVY